MMRAVSLIARGVSWITIKDGDWGFNLLFSGGFSGMSGSSTT